MTCLVVRGFIRAVPVGKGFILSLAKTAVEHCKRTIQVHQALYLLSYTSHAFRWL